MGKLARFEIVLGRQSAMCGEVIDGKVLLHLLAPMKMRGLDIEFSGLTKVNGDGGKDEAGSPQDVTSKETFTTSESYYKENRLLYGKDKSRLGEDDAELSEGSHEYPFQFLIPLNLPASVEHNHGHTRYVLRATIEKPWKRNRVIKTPFTVLNRSESGAVTYTPFSRSIKKTLGLPCRPAGEISMNIQLVRTTFAPGDTINIRGVLNNHSKRKIDYYAFRIRQKLVYKNPAESGDKEVYKLDKVAEIKHKEGIGSGESVSLRNEALLVPEPPLTSDLGGNMTVDCSYILEIKMVPSGGHGDLVMTIPLTITGSSSERRARTDPHLTSSASEISSRPFTHRTLAGAEEIGLGDWYTSSPANLSPKPARSSKAVTPSVLSTPSRVPCAEEIEDMYYGEDRARSNEGMSRFESQKAASPPPQRRPHLYPSLPRHELVGETYAPVSQLSEDSGIDVCDPSPQIVVHTPYKNNKPVTAVSRPQGTVIHTNMPMKQEVYSRAHYSTQQYNAGQTPSPALTPAAVPRGRPVGLMFSGGNQQPSRRTHAPGGGQHDHVTRVRCNHAINNNTPVTQSCNNIASPSSKPRNRTGNNRPNPNLGGQWNQEGYAAHYPSSQPNLRASNKPQVFNALSDYPRPFTYTPIVTPSAPPAASVYAAN